LDIRTPKLHAQSQSPEMDKGPHAKELGAVINGFIDGSKRTRCFHLSSLSSKPPVMSDQHDQDSSSRDRVQILPSQEVENAVPDTPINDTQATASGMPQSLRLSSHSASENEGSEPDGASTTSEQAATEENIAPTQQSSRTAVEPRSASDTRTTSHKRSVWLRPHQLVYQWIWEISSCFIAVLCLISIAVILAIHRDQPLPRWPKMISINSLIAIFTALMRAAIIFPVAQGTLTIIRMHVESILIRVGISQAKWLWFRHQPRNLIDFEQLDGASRGPWGSFLLLTKGRKK
jgi:hypothetical protein